LSIDTLTKDTIEADRTIEDDDQQHRDECQKGCCSRDAQIEIRPHMTDQRDRQREGVRVIEKKTDRHVIERERESEDAARDNPGLGERKGDVEERLPPVGAE